MPRLETHDMLSGVYITLRGYYRIYYGKSGPEMYRLGVVEATKSKTP